MIKKYFLKLNFLVKWKFLLILYKNIGQIGNLYSNKFILKTL